MPDATPEVTTTTANPATGERGLVPHPDRRGPCFGPLDSADCELELEVPEAHGVLALQPGMIGEDGTGGWASSY